MKDVVADLSSLLLCVTAESFTPLHAIVLKFDESVTAHVPMGSSLPSIRPWSRIPLYAGSESNPLVMLTV